MADPRTIDNLGLDSSTRYAEDQKRLDIAIIKDSKFIPKQAEIDVTTPYFPSEFESLFEVQKRNVPWGFFYAPQGYIDQKKRLFTHNLVPSLGTEDKIDVLVQRVSARVRPKKEREEKKRDEEVMSWEDQKEGEEEEREKKILLTLLNSIKALNKTLIDINSRRGQYQRG